jgi:hypothetical protein
VRLSFLYILPNSASALSKGGLLHIVNSTSLVAFEQLKLAALATLLKTIIA